MYQERLGARVRRFIYTVRTAVVINMLFVVSAVKPMRGQWGCWVVQTLQNNFSQMLNLFAQKHTLVAPEGLNQFWRKCTPYAHFPTTFQKWRRNHCTTVKTSETTLLVKHARAANFCLPLCFDYPNVTRAHPSD